MGATLIVTVGSAAVVGGGIISLLVVIGGSVSVGVVGSMSTGAE